ncbi:hypothetical protein [Asticcacaulis sp. MM231]|uniref:hypothetical protein n=1 Tax=Asticcacaulis sp. MM231 TaxID=3157666 RepID=UPI0032D5A308
MLLTHSWSKKAFTLIVNALRFIVNALLSALMLLSVARPAHDVVKKLTAKTAMDAQFKTPPDALIILQNPKAESIFETILRMEDQAALLINNGIGYRDTR